MEFPDRGPTDVEVAAARLIGLLAALLSVVRRQGPEGNEQACDQLIEEARIWPREKDWDEEIDEGTKRVLPDSKAFWDAVAAVRIHRHGTKIWARLDAHREVEARVAELESWAVEAKAAIEKLEKRVTPDAALEARVRKLKARVAEQLSSALEERRDRIALGKQVKKLEARVAENMAHADGLESSTKGIWFSLTESSERLAALEGRVGKDRASLCNFLIGGDVAPTAPRASCPNRASMSCARCRATRCRNHMDYAVDGVAMVCMGSLCQGSAEKPTSCPRCKASGRWTPPGPGGLWRCAACNATWCDPMGSHPCNVVGCTRCGSEPCNDTSLKPKPCALAPRCAGYRESGSAFCAEHSVRFPASPPMQTVNAAGTITVQLCNAPSPGKNMTNGHDCQLPVGHEKIRGHEHHVAEGYHWTDTEPVAMTASPSKLNEQATRGLAYRERLESMYEAVSVHLDVISDPRVVAAMDAAGVALGSPAICPKCDSLIRPGCVTIEIEGGKEAHVTGSPECNRR